MLVGLFGGLDLFQGTWVKGQLVSMDLTDLGPCSS